MKTSLRHPALPLLLLGSLGLAAIGGWTHAVAASSGGSQASMFGTGVRPSQLAVLPATHATASQTLKLVSGHIQDIEGHPVAGAVVTFNTQVALTDDDGNFELERVRSGAYLVTVEQPGYVTHQRAFTVHADTGENIFYGHLISRRPFLTADAGRGLRLQEDGMTLDLPANALRFEDDHRPVTGLFQIALTSINPANRWLSYASPAPLQGLRADGTQTSLRSLRMLNVEMRQNGRKLQLRPGVVAQVLMPVPEVGLSVGAPVPMWHHDELEGVWVEELEAEATLYRDTQGQLMARTRLPHFSSWNLDVPQDTVIARITYSSNNPNLEYLKVIETSTTGETGDCFGTYTTSTSLWSMMAQKADKTGDGPYEYAFFINLPQSSQITSNTWDAAPFRFTLEACESDINVCEGIELAPSPPGKTTGFQLVQQSPQDPNSLLKELRSCDVYTYLKDNGAHQQETASLGTYDGNFCGSTGYLSQDPSQPTVYADSCNNGVPSNSAWANGPDNVGIYECFVAAADGRCETWKSQPTSFASYRLDLVYSSGPGLRTSSTDAGSENYRLAALAGQRDLDQDGVANDSDNCPKHPNKDQADTDTDGFGDVCDPQDCTVFNKDVAKDSDRDTIANACDNLPSTYNPSQWYNATWYLDADGDGYGTVATTTIRYERPASNYVSRGGDCNDSNASVRPGGTEQANKVDDNCNGIVDDPFKVLIYNDAGYTYADDAVLARTGGSFTLVSTESTFNSAFDAGGFQLVIIDAAKATLPAGVSSRVTSWVGTSKPLIFAYWDLDANTSLADTLEVIVSASLTAWTDVYGLGAPGISVWQSVHSLPSKLTGYTKIADCGDKLTPKYTGASLRAGFTASANSTTKDAALLITRADRVIVHGFVPYNLQNKDLDADGTPDMKELYINELKFLGF